MNSSSVDTSKKGESKSNTPPNNDQREKALMRYNTLLANSPRSKSYSRRITNNTNPRSVNTKESVEGSHY